MPLIHGIFFEQRNFDAIDNNRHRCHSLILNLFIEFIELAEMAKLAVFGYLEKYVFTFFFVLS